MTNLETFDKISECIKTSSSTEHLISCEKMIDLFHQQSEDRYLTKLLRDKVLYKRCQLLILRYSITE